MEPAQEAWLDALVCERLSDDIQNDELRLNFTNSKVESLEDFITHRDTFDVDSDGELAVYVIKEGTEVIAYFTIQCGNLYEKVVKDEEMRFLNLFKSKDEGNISDSELVELYNFQALLNMTDLEMKRKAEEIERRIATVRPKKNDEVNYEEAADIKLVSKNFPAIEIVHFCKNDDYSGQFGDLFPDMRLGKILFMKKIVPVLQSVVDVIGCKYVYLFAVTNERDDKLVNHYRGMGFKSDPGFSVNKSLHASGCIFMAQPLKDLFNAAKEFTHASGVIHD